MNTAASTVTAAEAAAAAALDVFLSARPADAWTSLAFDALDEADDFEDGSETAAHDAWEDASLDIAGKLAAALNTYGVPAAEAEGEGVFLRIGDKLIAVPAAEFHTAVRPLLDAIEASLGGK